MNEAICIANMLGAVALLLWGLRMVSTGVTRTFGASLRRGINLGTDNRFKALLAGLFVTIALQSSTATCLMSASFAGRGLMSAATAQAIMLGANIGTSLVTKLLTFNVGPLSAVLLFLGIMLFRSGEGRRRHMARIFIGLGLMLLSLHLLDLASEPLRDSHQLRLVLHDLDGAWLVGLILAAVIAMLAHSSIASILLILPLAAKGDFSLPFGLALILGANLGSALPPLMETAKEASAVRRVPLGNAIVRASGCLLVLPFLDLISHALPLLESERSGQLIDFHIAFNLLLALAYLPAVGPMGRLVERLRPDETEAEDLRRPRYLDESALDSPSVAIGTAMRETLRIADVIETMLRQCLEVLRNGDARLAGDVAKMDHVVDALHQAVKLYLSRLPNEDMDEDSRRRTNEIMTFAINLEHIGDIIDHNLLEAAEKKLKLQLSFSREGFDDLQAMFEQTLANLKIAMAVFVSGDPQLARKLLGEKTEVRNLERAATESHLARLREGRKESIESSTLHLDILRDLKRINAHIASVAYPILENLGELEDSRLKAQAV